MLFATPLPFWENSGGSTEDNKVNIDYHVQYQHQYVGEKLELHASETF